MNDTVEAEIVHFSGTVVFNANDNAIDLQRSITDQIFRHKDMLPHHLGAHAVVLLILGVCVRKTVEWEIGPRKESLLGVFRITVAHIVMFYLSLFPLA